MIINGSMGGVPVNDVLDIVSLVANIVTILGIVAIPYGLYRIYKEIREGKPNIKVQVNFIMSKQLVSSQMAHIIGLDKVHKLIELKALNYGKIPIKFIAFGFILPNKMKMNFASWDGPRFPAILQPGDTCEILLEVGDIIKGLEGEHLTGDVKLIGYYLDSFDRRYTSKPYIFNIKTYK